MQWILAILLTNIGNMGNIAPEKLGRTRGELQKMPFSATQSEHLRIVQNRVPLEENDKLL